MKNIEDKIKKDQHRKDQHWKIVEKMKVRFDLLNENFKELVPEKVWEGKESITFDRNPPFTRKTLWIWNWVEADIPVKDNALGMEIHDMVNYHLIEFYNMDGSDGENRHYAIFPDGSIKKPLYNTLGFGSFSL